MINQRCCNYCTFQIIKKVAKEKGKEVETKPKDGGVDVFVNNVWVCWFMELPDYCAC